MQISVIIPAHNAQKFLSQTLAALLSKKTPNIQVLLVCDNCSDNTVEVAKKTFRRFDFTDYLIEEVSYGSTALSRNHGIRHASGEYIAFVDHDDIADSSMYERLRNFVNDFKFIDVVRCGYTTNNMDGSQTLTEILPDKNTYPFLGIFIWNGIFRKQFLVDHKIYFKPGYGEDYEFNLDILVHGAIEGRVEKSSSYYIWKHHDNNLHKKRTSDEFFARINGIIETKKNYLASNQAAKQAFVKWSIDYISHLCKQRSITEVAECYFKYSLIREYLTSDSLTLSDNRYTRLALKSANKSEFIAAITQREKKDANLAKIYRRYKPKSPIGKFFKTLYHCGNLSNFSSFYINDKKAKIRKRWAVNSSDKSLIDERIHFLNNHNSPKSLFLVFSGEFISGGLISIYSIADEMRASGIEPIMLGDPRSRIIPRNKKFPNQEVVIPFDSVVNNNFSNINYIMLPDVKVQQFIDLCKDYKLNFKSSQLNIMNQNIELMPTADVLNKLRPMVKCITMTTAHIKYSSQDICDKWNTPLKHISTYLSHTDYLFQTFKEKRPLILLSPDKHTMRPHVVNMIHTQLDHELLTIENLTYADYKLLVRRAQFCISFGEGLDNYFIEPFFTGSIGITAYNPEFMTEEFLELDNVFLSYNDMERNIVAFIHKLMHDNEYRYKLWQKNFEILSSLYDSSIYKSKFKEFLAGDFDFTPSRD